MLSHGEGSYRLCLLPNPYYGLNIIKICLNKNYVECDIGFVIIRRFDRSLFNTLF